MSEYGENFHACTDGGKVIRSKTGLVGKDLDDTAGAEERYADGRQVKYVIEAKAGRC